MEGLLLIDKPAGITSFDVIRVIRRAARTKKVGHTGTLDPDATGLLPVALGRCTKLAKYLQLDAKGYIFELRLGTRTDSLDATGEVDETKPYEHVTVEELRRALPLFVGEIQQVPPRFSAIHVQGKRAYQLARAGVDFELDARTIRIDSIEILEHKLPESATLRVDCGSGTYVRSLARDLGEALDTCAHAAKIRRVLVGPFAIDRAVPLDELETPEDVAEALLSPLEMLVALASVELSDSDFEDIRHGRPIVAPEGFAADDDVSLVYQSELAAVGLVVESRGGLIIKPKRVLLTD